MLRFNFDLKVERLKRNDPDLTIIEFDKEPGPFRIHSFKHLIEALKKNKTLKELGLQDMGIGDTPFDLSYFYIPIAEILKTNCGLRKLNLSNNQMGDAGLIVLANALEINQGLEELDLRQNSISLKVIETLEKALLKNTTLMRISISEEEKPNNNLGVKKFLKEMEDYADYCNTYKQAFPGSIYAILITLPIVVCDMIVDYCKNNEDSLPNPLRQEVKECQKSRNQMVSVPQSMFFDKNDSKENVESLPKKKLKIN